jgi:hypothetical protein
MAENSLHWGDTYAPVVYKWFNTGVDSINSLIPALYDVNPSSKAAEYDLAVGSVPTDQWDIYNERGQVPYVAIDQGYATTYTHVTYPVRFVLERAFIDDDELGQVQNSLKAVGMSAAEKRETDAASVFNNAFSSSFVGADAVSLCNASHPYGPDNTGDTHGNAGSSAFAYAAITASRVLMRQFVNSQGNPNPRIGRLALIGNISRMLPIGSCSIPLGAKCS